MRWPIEQCFQDGKSEVGMDQYEHRSWPAWHRHMLYVFLALQFLLRLRLRLKKSACPDAPSGANTNHGCAAVSNDDARARFGTCQVLQDEKLHRISVSQKEEIESTDHRPPKSKNSTLNYADLLMIYYETRSLLR